MDNRRNYYRILQVQPDAPAEVIQASHRTLMQRLRMHPDLGGDTWNAAVINEAFATLGDPARREAYDRTLVAGLHERRAPAEAAAQDPAPTPALDPPQASARTTVIRASMRCAFCGTRHSVSAAQRHDARCAECQSPLCAVQSLDLGDETAARAVERLDRRLPVQLVVSWPARVPLAATSEDISIHGIRLLVPVQLPIGARVSVACNFCDAVGEVTHVQPQADAKPAAWRTGVRFLTISVRQSRGGIVSLRA